MSSKKVQYFSHDANARNDERILLVRMKYGMKGYGIFFAIIELLREAKGYTLPNNSEAIAFTLHEQKEAIADIIKNYKLFKFDKGKKNFWSESLKTRMKKMEHISNVRAEAGSKGGKAK